MMRRAAIDFAEGRSCTACCSLLTAGFLLAVASWPGAALAQTTGYPVKPIRLIIPYPPGGGTDTIARPLAQRLTDNLGQQVIVDNRGGAGGSIGMEFVARSAPDGYTLVVGLTAQLAVNPSLYSKLPYDPVKDFSPITLLGEQPYLLLVHPSVPAKSVREFIALARAHPGQLAYASSGNGSGAHLAAEMLKTMTHINLVHIPYKGAGLALPDLIAGQVQFSFITHTTSGPLVQSGRLRALGVTTAKRSPALPDLPAIAETVPGYDSAVWYGVLAPAGTPRQIVARLNREILRVMGASDFRQRFTMAAVTPIGGTPEQLGEHIRSEIARWAKLVRESGARID